MTAHAYVLGHPIAHSKSPAMHNAAYRALGIDWDYALADCETESEAQGFLENGDWSACNVTMPYKPLALRAADQATSAARIAGGANVLVRGADGMLHADNTDGVGCVSYLQRCGVRFDGAHAAVCGTGPTAVSIMHALVDAGVCGVALLSRDAKRAEDALARCAGEMGESSGRARACAYGDAQEIVRAADVVVDATPLGMHEGDPAPFDTAWLSSGQVVFDVVYGHGLTALMQAARESGCRAFDGAGMLVAQAVETVRDIAEITGAFSIPADVDVFAIMAQVAGFDHVVHGG